MWTATTSKPSQNTHDNIDEKIALTNTSPIFQTYIGITTFVGQSYHICGRILLILRRLPTGHNKANGRNYMHPRQAEQKRYTN